MPQNASLKIKISSLSKCDTITSESDTSQVIIPAAIWGYYMGSSINWLISDFDRSLNTQTFTSIETGKPCDLKMRFEKGAFLIEYFEMNTDLPRRKKIIYVY